ncbi:MAG: Ni/Fe hydrogenase subunit alpha [Rhodospirillales bacterium]|jgi:coenzyme F420-reducing hydrogenase alpha subunit|nr:Ni/Fe hydrogenase subunit alpha [Rhodospirillales bacterium]
MPSRTIRVDYLTRVEGEGALELDIRDGAVDGVRLSIFEPPRFFEALLRGRDATEAPDITARICGICPVAYQMSSVHAVENALGLAVPPPIRALRRLLYCGEWIESHALHIVLLHAPDFLGFPDAISMASAHGEMVTRGLALKKTGNALLRLLGGREIHPVNVRVGGFYRAPTADELAALVPDLQAAREQAVALARWVAGFRFPDFERDYEFVALRHPDEYPLNEGRLVSNRGLDIPVSDYDATFEERHVAHSTALQSVLRARGSYQVGPLARFNLNHDRLGPSVQALAAELGLAPGCRNPFRSIIVRAIEVVYACEEALRLIAAYAPPEAPFVAAPPQAGIGVACTEAPRGILYHHYRLNADGSILSARIVPPTSQNQGTIEEDLRIVATRDLDLPEDELRDHCEQAIRNYDPCISCSTHFLRLEVRRR